MRETSTNGRWLKGKAKLDAYINMLEEKTLFDEPAFQFAAGLFTETLVPGTMSKLNGRKEFELGRITAQYIPSTPLKILTGTTCVITAVAEHFDLHRDPDISPWDCVP